MDTNRRMIVGHQGSSNPSGTLLPSWKCSTGLGPVPLGRIPKVPKAPVQHLRSIFIQVNHLTYDLIMQPFLLVDMVGFDDVGRITLVWNGVLG